VNEDIRESVGLDIRDIAGTVRLDTPHINLRFDGAENLVASFEQAHPILPITAEDIAARSTIGLYPEPDTVVGTFFRKTWDIWTVDDIQSTTTDFVKHVMNKAMPFWHRYSDPEETLNLLLRDDEEARVLAGPDHFRAERAVGMTFLLRGIEQAQEVAEAKVPKIRHAAYRQEFLGWKARFFEKPRVVG